MKEVTYYQCFLGENDARIVLKGRDYQPVGEMVFGSPTGGSRYGDLPTMRMRREELHTSIDILRNEGPLYLDKDDRSGSYFLRSDDELVGEGDSTPQSQPRSSR